MSTKMGSWITLISCATLLVFAMGQHAPQYELQKLLKKFAAGLLGNKIRSLPKMEILILLLHGDCFSTTAGISKYHRLIIFYVSARLDLMQQSSYC